MASIRSTSSAKTSAVNVEGKVPTLLVDGRATTEVAAILFYLVRRFPTAGLLPANDIEARPRDVLRCGDRPSCRRWGMDHARKVYAVADQRLGKRTWAIGVHSIADIHLFRLYWRFFNSLHPASGEFPKPGWLVPAHDGAPCGVQDHRDRGGDRP